MNKNTKNDLNAIAGILNEAGIELEAYAYIDVAYKLATLIADARAEMPNYVVEM